MEVRISYLTSLDDEGKPKSFGEEEGEWDEDEVGLAKGGRAVEAVFEVMTVFAFLASMCCLVVVCSCYIGCYYGFHQSVKTHELVQSIYNQGPVVNQPNLIGVQY